MLPAGPTARVFWKPGRVALSGCAPSKVFSQKACRCSANPYETSTVKTAPGPINLIIESNSLLQFLKPSAYLAVLDPQKQDFKPTAQSLLDRADAFVLRHTFGSSGQAWPQIPASLFHNKPAFLQMETRARPRPAARFGESRPVARSYLTHLNFCAS